MNVLEALILGIVQGLTEFLPISSSGHLVLAEHLLGVKPGDLSFEVATHFATLIAVGIYFFPILNRILVAPIRVVSGSTDPIAWRDFRLFLVIVIATIPAVAVGLLLGDFVESAFSSAKFASAMLLVTSAVLLATRLARVEDKHIGFANGLIVGCAQALAILPGISRSGSTIAAGLFAGVSRREAFNFSFVLSVPAVLGATAFTASNAMSAGVTFLDLNYIVGMVAAFICGYFSIMLLERIVVSGRFALFGFYTLIVGLLGLIFIG